MVILLSALLLAAPADVLILRAELPTLGGTAPADADAIAILGGKIVAVGRGAELEKEKGPRTQVIDARGRMVLPGIIDAHLHFLSGGLDLVRVDAYSARGMVDIWARIKAYAAKNPKAPWITGRGWRYDIFQTFDPPYPSRQMLDRAIADRPVFLRSYDGHAGWANTAALEAAGITAATPDPKDGKILREKDGKTPQGTLLEGALELIKAKLPVPSESEKRQAILLAQELALRHGIVAIDDFDSDLSTADLYLALEREGLLKLEVFLSPALEVPLVALEAMREKLKQQSKRVRLATLKLSVDGVVEANAAAMLEPYADNPKLNGQARFDADALATAVATVDAKGFDVSLHATGDRGVRIALDAIERVIEQNAARDRRHRIEHIELLHPADASRFKALGVLASMHPFHAEPLDAPEKGVWEKKVGKKRWPNAFAWKQLAGAGALLVFSSDWASMSLNPLRGLAVATSRQNGHGLPAAGFAPEQRLDFTRAADAYTRHAAYAVRAEDRLGELEVGRAANLIVLSDTIDKEEPLSLYWGRIDLTLIDGRVVSAP